MNDLNSKKCKPCEGGVAPLTADAAAGLLHQINEWHLHDKQINKIFSFKNYYQTIAFVNAVAWISHQEDHHPDMAVSYNRCEITYTTHAIGGLSENDFICAAKIDKLFGS